mmetsp:Transcript_13360/g.16239  ORF Transcript_13360/g.16239 Transcript_13360/m.16239 type:complete len:140 (+) Transcript_13360:494-913(+)
MKTLSYADGNAVIMNGFSAGAVIAEWMTYGITDFGIPSPPVKAVITCSGMLTLDADEMKSMVGPNAPPAFIIHSIGDKVVPCDSAILMANRFEELRRPYILHIETGKAHLIDHFEINHSDGMTIVEAEIAWLDSFEHPK